MKEKVLFLGCNSDQVPYLQAIKRLGFKVIGTDRNSDAPGAKLADKFYQASYLDIDGLKKIAMSENFTMDDKIFTASSHFAYEAAAQVAESIGIPYISRRSVDICLDKSKLYTFLKDFGVPIPETRTYKPLDPSDIKPSIAYFLKSDYGKSSHFCYRIVNGKMPPLPKQFDQFFRSIFLLQEEVIGTHYRLNFYSGQASIFLKLSDSTAIGIKSLGIGHNMILEKLSRAIESLGLSLYLVKFDIIVNESGWYVIDLGLDPPFRLKLLCDYMGMDFEMAYVKYYLLSNASALPCWPDICKPILISKTAGGFSFTDLGKDML